MLVTTQQELIAVEASLQVKNAMTAVLNIMEEAFEQLFHAFILRAQGDIWIVVYDTLEPGQDGGAWRVYWQAREQLLRIRQSDRSIW